MSANNATVVLVHGAWADVSSWAKVIAPLSVNGISVVAVPLPLTSFDDDVQALNRTIDRTAGPIVLVGYAYAGAVIGAADNIRVKGLVYVAALTPDEGETVADVFYRGKPHPLAPQLAPDSKGFIYLPEEAGGFYPTCFCGRALNPGGSSAPDLSGLHHRSNAATPLERPSGLVRGGRARSHDRSCDPALHGNKDESSGAVPSS